MVQPNRDRGSWMLTLGDRRLLVQTSEPSSSQCPAVQLGTVSVETETVDAEGGIRSSVANVCAMLDSEGAPVWRLLRMERNDMARPQMKVSEARSDGLGAVSVQDLEAVLENQSERGAGPPSATIKVDTDLTVEELTELFVAEVEAIDRGVDRTV